MTKPTSQGRLDPYLNVELPNATHADTSIWCSQPLLPSAGPDCLSTLININSATMAWCRMPQHVAAAFLSRAAHSLKLEVRLQAPLPLLAPASRFLVAAEWTAAGAGRAVEPNNAGSNSLGNTT